MHVCDLTYRMAPEVIEMRGPGDDPKSDVWSVACVVIELLTGAPPYFEMQPMPALFAIARGDARERIPPGVRRVLYTGPHTTASAW